MNTAEFFFKRANTNFDQGKVEDAFSDLDQAINLAPYNFEYRKLRAILRYEGEEYEAAIEDFSVLVQITLDMDERLDFYEKRAISYEKLGLYNELIEDLTWIIDHEMGEATTYAWRGHHYKKQGDYQSAIADFQQARILSPKNYEDLLQIAQCRYHMGQYKLAIKDLTQILDESDKHPNFLAGVYHWRGLSYFKLGDTQQALSDFNEVMRIHGGELLSNAADYIPFSVSHLNMPPLDEY